MKKFRLTVAVTAVVFSFTAFISSPASKQTVQHKNPIPHDVLIIVKKSCINCHAEPGKVLALSHVNLSKWDTYTVEKQADKSQEMCDMVTKGKMPPKQFWRRNPDFVLTKGEIKTICDWSQTLKVIQK